MSKKDFFSKRSGAKPTIYACTLANDISCKSQLNMVVCFQTIMYTKILRNRGFLNTNVEYFTWLKMFDIKKIDKKGLKLWD